MFDLGIVTTPQGWIGAELTPQHIEVARERFFARQARCDAQGLGPHFIPDDWNEDHRWCGELGEMLVKDYLEQRAYDHHWLAGVRESEYDPDFLINRIKIDVKTKRRKYMPKYRDDYFETVCHDQFVLAQTRDTKGFIFCDYAYKVEWIYLVGKISYAQFDKIKIERNSGDQVHKDYVVTAKSWDVPITALTPPLKWIKAA